METFENTHVIEAKKKNNEENNLNGVVWDHDNNTVTIYITGTISRKADWFYPALIASRQAHAKKSKIYLEINSPGGEVFAAAQLFESLDLNEGRIVVSVVGMCYSAATLLLCQLVKSSVSQVYISELSEFLFHPMRAGVSGRTPEIKDHFQNLIKYEERIIKSSYTDILTEDEIQQILNGKELYIEPKEVGNRLRAYSNKLREKAELKQQIIEMKKEVDNHLVKSFWDKYKKYPIDTDFTGIIDQLFIKDDESKKEELKETKAPKSRSKKKDETKE
nr:MAG TPA: Putative ATP dependent Clp protease [Caudoviricetes sp.]